MLERSNEKEEFLKFQEHYLTGARISNKLIDNPNLQRKKNTLESSTSYENLRTFEQILIIKIYYNSQFLIP